MIFTLLLSSSFPRLFLGVQQYHFEQPSGTCRSLDIPSLSMCQHDIIHQLSNQQTPLSLAPVVSRSNPSNPAVTGVLCHVCWAYPHGHCHPSVTAAFLRSVRQDAFHSDRRRLRRLLSLKSGRLFASVSACRCGRLVQRACHPVAAVG